MEEVKLEHCITDLEMANNTKLLDKRPEEPPKALSMSQKRQEMTKSFLAESNKFISICTIIMTISHRVFKINILLSTYWSNLFYIFFVGEFLNCSLKLFVN